MVVPRMFLKAERTGKLELHIQAIYDMLHTLFSSIGPQFIQYMSITWAEYLFGSLLSYRLT